MASGGGVVPSFGSNFIALHWRELSTGPRRAALAPEAWWHYADTEQQQLSLLGLRRIVSHFLDAVPGILTGGTRAALDEVAEVIFEEIEEEVGGRELTREVFNQRFMAWFSTREVARRGSLSSVVDGESTGRKGSLAEHPSSSSAGSTSSLALALSTLMPHVDHLACPRDMIAPPDPVKNVAHFVTKYPIGAFYSRVQLRRALRERDAILTPPSERTDAQRQCVAAVVAGFTPLQSACALDESERESVAEVISFQQVQAGHVITREHARETECYLLLCGEAEVVLGAHEQNDDNDDDDAFAAIAGEETLVNVLSDGDAFGHLAVLSQEEDKGNAVVTAEDDDAPALPPPRSATVRARTECMLAVLTREAFTRTWRAIDRARQRRRVQFLSYLPPFRDTPVQTCVVLSRLAVTTHVHRGDVVIQQGSNDEIEDERIFGVVSGRFRVLREVWVPSRRKSAFLEIDEHGPYEMFGLDGRPRAVSVVCEETGELLSLRRADIARHCKKTTAAAVLAHNSYPSNEELLDELLAAKDWESFKAEMSGRRSARGGASKMDPMFQAIERALEDEQEHENLLEL